MPTVEKVAGGRVHVRGIGEFSPGDRATVSEADAAYLCDERGDFERVPNTGSDGDETSGDDPDPEPEPVTPADQINAGVCPWCDEYEGDAVAQHASSAHPDEWAAYKEE